MLPDTECLEPGNGRYKAIMNIATITATTIKLDSEISIIDQCMNWPGLFKLIKPNITLLSLIAISKQVPKEYLIIPLYFYKLKTDPSTPSKRSTLYFHTVYLFVEYFKTKGHIPGETLPNVTLSQKTSIGLNQVGTKPTLITIA